MDVVVEVSTMDFPTVEVTVEVVEEVPLQINFQLLKPQLELAGKLLAGTSVETSVNWNFKLELQVNFQLYKRRRKIQSNGSFTSRCVSNTWRIACTSISSTSKSLVMNLLTLTMDIQILTMNFEC